MAHGSLPRGTNIDDSITDAPGELNQEMFGFLHRTDAFLSFANKIARLQLPSTQNNTPPSNQ